MNSLSKMRWDQSIENLKAYFVQHESNPENPRKWAKVHDQVAAWISTKGTTGKLLDAGCRRGELKRSTKFPSQIEYVGIDPVRVDEFAYDFEYRCETLETTTYGERTFEFVLIKDSIDCFEDPIAAIASAFRVLNLGGLLLISEDGFVESAGGFVTTIAEFLKGGPRQTKSNAHATYPNGDLSLSYILRCIGSTGFRGVERHIVGSRLFISAIRS